MSLVAGQILDGKYRIVRVLGTGGMGAVYEGENTRIHRKVAIKVLHASVASKQDIVQRFEREAQAAGRIGSQHIVEVLDLGNLESGERYMVMEFLDGEPLTKRIKVRGRISPHELAPLLLQLLDGLGGAHHAGIIHRDLKPDNVYIVRRQGQDFVKLLDFGVSKFTSAGEELSMTKTGAVMGTPYYMSPEQARGQTVDLRSDLYSVGVVAYQCLAGRVPYNAETFNELIFKIALEAPEPLETVAPGVDPGFAAIVRKAMEREVGQRFQTAGDFARALYDWQQGAGATHAAQQVHAPQQGYSPQMARSNPQLSQSGAGMQQSGGYGGQLGQSSPNALGGSNPGFSSHPGLANTGPNGALLSTSQGGAAHTQGTPAPTVLAEVPPANASGKSKGGLIAAVLALVVVGAGGAVGFAKMKGTAPTPATAATVEATATVATTATATSTATAVATTATASTPPAASESAAPPASSEPEPSASVATASSPKPGPGRPVPIKTTPKPDTPPPPPKPTGVGGRPIDPSL